MSPHVAAAWRNSGDNWRHRIVCALMKLQQCKYVDLGKRSLYLSSVCMH